MLTKLIEFVYLSQERLLKYLRDFFSQFYVKIYCIINIFFNIFLWVLTYIINKQSSDNLITLHYNVDFGVNLIGLASQIYIIPLLGLIIIIINSFVASIFIKFKQGHFIAHLLLASVSFVHAFLFLGIVSVYLINFRL
jgi:hypothetical protein